MIPFGRKRGGRRPEFDIAPYADALPHTTPERRFRGVGCGTLAFGVLAGLFTVGFVIYAEAEREPPGLIIAAGLALVTAVLLGAAAWHWFLRCRWHFTPDEVRRERRTLFGRRTWAEPLSSYRGVLPERQTSQIHGQGPLYILRLKHKTHRRRTVELYRSRSADGLRQKQEHYAKLFGRPALVKIEGGYRERRVEDLGRSVRERVAAGTLRVEFDPSLPPPGRSIRVAIDGDRLLIQARGYGLRVARKSVLPILAAGGVMLQLVARQNMSALWVAAVVGAQLVVTLAAALGLILVPNELVVSPHEVRTRWRHPWGTFKESAIPADQVEEVVVGEPMTGKEVVAVQIISDTKAISFGAHLAKQQMEWVRDCIIAVISK